MFSKCKAEEGRQRVFAMTTLIRNTMTRKPVFTSYRLHIHPRTYASEHPRQTSSPTSAEPVVELFSGPSKKRSAFVRKYATEQSKPPPPSSRLEIPVETFSAPARPQPYYAKHPSTRALPKQQKTWPYLLAAVLVGVAGWAGFMTYVTNQEMISSSVVRQIMRCVREDTHLREVLGEAIRPQPEWWLNGDPKINGRISTLQGNIDVSMRIRGTKGSGTLYFTSIRKDKGMPFTILRFKVICDDGTVIVIDAEPV